LVLTKGFIGMVKIRLARGGAKKRPFYHIVVADSRNKRDGRRIERIGFFNPLARGQEERLRVDLERVDYWTGVGAQVSERVKFLVSQARSSAAA
jgi:small subunit ribosomal protein S16